MGPMDTFYVYTGSFPDIYIKHYKHSVKIALIKGVKELSKGVIVKKKKMV